MDLYMSYRLPKEFNFENRFRVGEIPIGIAEYTSYNLLSVSAPEIKGQWGMVPVPGTKRADGSINNTVPITVQGSIMLSATKSKENSWEFLKWWTSTNTQLRFGKELESIMGTAARYNSANIDAIKQLPWPSNDKKMILEQLGKTKGIPEVPGGYYTSRNLEFAIRKVFNENVNPNETILSYIKSINDEIKLKRIEFGLK
jgi:ABC-type glycerol-3-phosphate transport system substrate-binding protein